MYSGFSGPKNAKIAVISRSACKQRAAQKAQFLAIEIISCASQHLKDVTVPFIPEFL